MENKADLTQGGSQQRDFQQQVQEILAHRVRSVVEDPSLICAAVLIPLLSKGGEWHVLVTQRTQNVGHHKGQISFPGGACEPVDADLQATALRETFEEIGVPPEAVQVLGALDDFVTITDFVVAPFVGVIPHPFAYRLNGCEVDAVIEVPLSFLQDRAHLRTEQREVRGRVYDVLFWNYGPYTIWGATAQMLKSLLDLL
ncbi:MAG: CoA pyrophosphatase [Anaerolineae bacterium]|jgi:8-oxo-dGTP pyrophosphatase MutT (NUDIX family)